jgi:hypothetical protein
MGKGPIWPECVGSGFCCKKAPCGLAVMRGFEAKHWMEGGKGCPALVEKDGRYWCGLYLQAAGAAKTHIKNELAIGAGCCSSLFNTDRERILRKRRET